MNRVAARGLALAGALTLVASFGPIGGARVLAAAPYAMQTSATYQVVPADGTVSVTVAVAFTNTTPDPTGRYSLYTTVPIPVQDGASHVAAEDAKGTLKVKLGSSGSGRLVTVTLRTALRYRKTASFTLTYQLADGANPRVRVRPSAVLVPVWSFGTAGSVSVSLPTGFAVSVIGDPLSLQPATDRTLLSSGPIADPASWLSLLTATNSAGYETLQRSVPLTGGTVDLQVRAWSDDAAWGSATLDLLARGLPALQVVIGLPYTGDGPLVVTESLPISRDPLAEPAPGTRQINLAFTASPFVALHQVAHVWLGSNLAAARWIREGLASRAAADVATSLGLSLPFDPAHEAAARSAAAIPLASWSEPGAGTASPAAASATDAYGYAASWDTVDKIVATVGERAVREVLARVAAGVGAYDPSPAAAGSASGGDAAGAVLPLTSERFLDQLEQVSGKDLSTLFADRVLSADQLALLAERPAARSAYAGLAVAAGEWGVPEPIRQLMESWRFAEARTAIAGDGAWLPQRDAFLSAVNAAGLATPANLVALWRAAGAGTATRAELTAESAFVTAYRSAQASIGGDPNPVQRLGLLGAPAPQALLTSAAGRFAAGDLAAAVDDVRRAMSAARNAQASGVVRIAIGLALLAVVAAGISLLARRLRRWRVRRGSS